MIKKFDIYPIVTTEDGDYGIGEHLIEFNEGYNWCSAAEGASAEEAFRKALDHLAACYPSSVTQAVLERMTEEFHSQQWSRQSLDEIFKDDFLYADDFKFIAELGEKPMLGVAIQVEIEED